MDSRSQRPVVIAGGGPAGSVAALCLTKLGREVTLLERQTFPRYRIGESLLPGTISILSRLGLGERIAAANFPTKRGATFVWGDDRPPWTFPFNTPKALPWVFDHAYQVNRAEFDKILLDAATERGADVRIGDSVFEIDTGSVAEPARLRWKSPGRSGILETPYVIDATGGDGLTARAKGLRTWDPYFRNMAVWTYFKGGKRFTGHLDGNTFSVAWKEGWFWIIPLKDDTYSVGLVTDMASHERIRDVGLERFFHNALRTCGTAMEILDGSVPCDEIHIHRDWSYEATAFTVGRTFLCGDSACFIDPLFSQGVHLAVFSAMLASAAIDYLLDTPEAHADVCAWYEQTYRDAYQRYHKFLAAFYSVCGETDSHFWSSRKIQGAADQRFVGKDWFHAMTGQDPGAGADVAVALKESATTLGRLWQQGPGGLSAVDAGDAAPLKRVAWVNEQIRQIRGLAGIRWAGSEARLVPSFKVHPTTFKLERRSYLADETGRSVTAYPFREEHRRLFEDLSTHPLTFAEITTRLQSLDPSFSPLQAVLRMFEEGLLRGFDRDGSPVDVRSVMRFGGVGAEDELS